MNQSILFQRRCSAFAVCLAVLCCRLFSVRRVETGHAGRAGLRRCASTYCRLERGRREV